MKFWEEDLPTPTVMLAELKEWVAHWEKRPAQSHPVSLLGCLQHADEDQFPNVKQLLCIGCTLPVGDCRCRATLQCFPKDQNEPAKQDVTCARPSFETGSDACRSTMVSMLTRRRYARNTSMSTGGGCSSPASSDRSVD